MRISLARIAIALLLASLPSFAQPPKLFSEIDEILAALSRITGWQVKHKVRSETLSRAAFAKIMEQDVRDAEGDKDAHAAEITLKLFGLVPWDYNLVRESADLMEEQTAAFYDYKKKRLVVLDSPVREEAGPQDEEQQRVALAHELAHALADQQFDLRRYIDGAKEDDAATARQSVIEGQAHWLSWAYMAERTTGRPEVPRALLNQLSDIGATGDEYPELTGAPLYIRESLLFPYSEGMKFQDAAFRKLGQQAFARVFRDAPLSTQEILHPDRYEDEVRPAKPVLAALEPLLGKETKRWKRLVEGDVGEFDYSAMLRQFGSQTAGREIASHWRGGSYAIFENKQTKDALLTHASEWDSPEAARAFLRAYVSTLRGKWKDFRLERDSGNEITGSGDRGDFVLRISGTTVQCIEGLPVAKDTHRTR
jgi:hypothetical protein